MAKIDKYILKAKDIKTSAEGASRIPCREKKNKKKCYTILWLSTVISRSIRR